MIFFLKIRYRVTASPDPNLVLGHVNSYEFTILRLLSTCLPSWVLPDLSLAFFDVQDFEAV